MANWLASGQAMGCTGMGGVAGVEAYNAKGGTGRFYVISLRNDEGSAAGYVVTSTDSDTVLFVYPRGGGAKFFRPAIRQR